MICRILTSIIDMLIPILDLPVARLRAKLRCKARSGRHAHWPQTPVASARSRRTLNIGKPRLEATTFTKSTSMTIIARPGQSENCIAIPPTSYYLQRGLCEGLWPIRPRKNGGWARLGLNRVGFQPSVPTAILLAMGIYIAGMSMESLFIINNSKHQSTNRPTTSAIESSSSTTKYQA